jgi:hypothetical protein
VSQPGLAFQTGPVDGKRRIGCEAIIQDVRQTDDMAVGMDVVFVGLA